TIWIEFICTLEHALDYFFFSSRRRHTRSKRDWSSDVCSSDLLLHEEAPREPRSRSWLSGWTSKTSPGISTRAVSPTPTCSSAPRSEERRVGKECSSGCALEPEEKEEGQKERHATHQGQTERRC